MLDDHGDPAIISGIPLFVVREDGGTRCQYQKVGATLDRCRRRRRADHNPGRRRHGSLQHRVQLLERVHGEHIEEAQAGSFGDALQLGHEARHGPACGGQVRCQQRLKVAVVEAVAARVAAGELDRSCVPVGQLPADDAPTPDRVAVRVDDGQVGHAASTVAPLTPGRPRMFACATSRVTESGRPGLQKWEENQGAHQQRLGLLAFVAKLVQVGLAAVQAHAPPAVAATGRA